MKTHLSKSQFIRALQCHKSLWLYKHNPELITPTDAGTQKIFDTGNVVGELACDLFPGGKKVEFDYKNFDGMIEETALHIKKGMETIYEATFRFDNIIVMVDILKKGKKGWKIYEVKSTTSDKPVHINDLSIQYYVLNGCGINISKASLVHINNKYERVGDLNINELFNVVDLTDKVIENQSNVSTCLADIQFMITGDCPDIDIGKHCNAPYDCDFIDHCWSHIPENSVFDLRGIGIDKFSSYKKGEITFSDLKLKELNVKQSMQVEAELTGKSFINKPAIKDFLNTIYYPLCFLDFETFQNAIPPFDNIRPYAQITFQYSLHYLESETAELKHYEFLAEAGVDPREALAKNLIEQIPENACTLAYNMGFEKGRIRSLADLFPKYKTKLMDIHDHIIDLMVPFRNRYYYTKDMKGSYSIKYVLPALVPELSYDGMNVSNGQDAMIVFDSLSKIKDKDEVQKIRDDLLKYCKLDTFAMVKLFTKLKHNISADSYI